MVLRFLPHFSALFASNLHYFSVSSLFDQPYVSKRLVCLLFWLFLKHYALTGAPRAEGGPRHYSNITHLWFCAVQNRQEKWHTFHRIFKWSQKKKVFTKIETVFLFKFRWSPKKGLRGFISMGPMKPIGPSRGPLQAHGPPKIHGPRGHCPPLPSLSEALCCNNTFTCPFLRELKSPALPIFNHHRYSEQNEKG